MTAKLFPGTGGTRIEVFWDVTLAVPSYQTTRRQIPQHSGIPKSHTEQMFWIPPHFCHIRVAADITFFKADSCSTMQDLAGFCETRRLIAVFTRAPPPQVGGMLLQVVCGGVPV
jgi:hypothetical protein